MRKTLTFLAALLIILTGGIRGAAQERSGRILKTVKDHKADFESDDCAIFSTPVALSVWGDALYVVDAQDCAVKVFSRMGRHVKDIGRQGKGPGEFDHPSSLARLGEKIYIADAFNNRVHILDPDGRPLGGFKLAESPNQLIVLGEGRIVVSHHPGLPPRPEKLVRCYDEKGKLLWEALDALMSSDAIYDLFRNQLVLMNAGDGTFFIANKCDNRLFRRYDGDGRFLGRIEAAPDRKPRRVSLPLKSGKKEVTPFCWDCAFEKGKFFVLLPEFPDDRDVGPGRVIRVVDGGGRTVEEIELPGPVKRIWVEGDWIFAFDIENALRIFQVVR